MDITITNPYRYNNRVNFKASAREMYTAQKALYANAENKYKTICNTKYNPLVKKLEKLKETLQKIGENINSAKNNTEQSIKDKKLGILTGCIEQENQILQDLKPLGVVERNEEMRNYYIDNMPGFDRLKIKRPEGTFFREHGMWFFKKTRSDAANMLWLIPPEAIEVLNRAQERDYPNMKFFWKGFDDDYPSKSLDKFVNYYNNSYVISNWDKIYHTHHGYISCFNRDLTPDDFIKNPKEFPVATLWKGN